MDVSDFIKLVLETTIALKWPLAILAAIFIIMYAPGKQKKKDD